MPLQLIRELDRAVFRKKWVGLEIVPGEGEGLPDKIEVRWNAKLRNTAGRASWKTCVLFVSLALAFHFVWLTDGDVLPGPEKAQ